MSNGNCSVKLAGIQVHYCVGKERRSVWVDLDEVSAIAWTSREVKKKDPDLPTHECDPIPKTAGLRPCAPDFVGDEGPLCWWNGVDWVCGEA